MGSEVAGEGQGFAGRVTNVAGEVTSLAGDPMTVQGRTKMMHDEIIFCRDNEKLP
jgi:hypothetical protein